MALTLAKIQIGWISALTIEALLAEVMLDEVYEQAIVLPPHDDNIYTYGRVNITGSNSFHVIAIAQLPLSTVGKASAATVANNMRRTFPNLKFGIMVGIAGGVWTEKADVRLGDIVVGVPDGGGPGVLQYDHGKAIQDQDFVVTGSMNKAPDVLRTAAGLLKRKHMRRPGTYESSLENTEVKQLAPRPAVDNLFSTTYLHQSGSSCEGCAKTHLHSRASRPHSLPKVHYGAIASADQVVKDAVLAQKIQEKHNILCFEMEAAGLDAFPCLVVRGISDYADTHKNDDWQAYAAAAAAAYAKELLTVLPLTAVTELPSTGNTHWNVPRTPSPLFAGRESLLRSMKKHLIVKPGTNCPVFVLEGIGGAGKSEAAIKFATEFQDSFWGVFWIDADNRQSIEQGFVEIAKLQTPTLSDTSVKAVLQWLVSRKESWLLILDNCDDSATDFSKYLPSRGGSVIITTRLSECRAYGSYETIDDLGQQASVQLLLDTCGVKQDHRQAQEYHAAAVVSLLGNHALALVHAGAYVEKGYCSLSEYSRCFQAQAEELMRFKLVQKASRYGSVYTTFEISAVALASAHDEDGHLALCLLDLLAFFDPEGVGEDIFSSAFEFCQDLEDHCGIIWDETQYQGTRSSKSSQFGNYLAGVCHYKQCADMNESDDCGEIHHLDVWHCEKVRSTGLMGSSKNGRLRSAFVRLSGLSLARVDGNNISMHPLVHEWARIRLGESARQEAWEKALCVLALSTAGPEERTVPTNADSPEIVQPQICLGEFYNKTGKMRKTISLLTPLWERFWQFSHDNIIRSRLLWQLAYAHLQLGENTRAIDFSKRVVNMDPKLFASQDPIRFASRDVLIKAYINMGNRDSATNLVQHLTYSWRTLSLDLSSRLSQMFWTVNAYVALGKDDQALNMLEQVSSELQVIRTSEHDRLSGMSMLANAYLVHGQNDKAIMLLEEVVPSFKICTSRESRRLYSMELLAMAYIEVHRHDQAIILLEEVVTKLPLYYPDESTRLSGMKSLAKAYLKIGRPDKAELLFEEVIAKLRVGHRLEFSRLNFMIILAEIYAASHKYDEAVIVLEESVALIHEQLAKLLEDESFEFADADLSLAHETVFGSASLVYIQLQQFQRAADLVQSILCNKSGTRFHYRILLALQYQLAVAYVDLNDDLVDKFLATVQQMNVMHPQDEYPSEVVSLLKACILTDVYVRAHQSDAAEHLIEETLEQMSRILPADHRNLAAPMYQLAMVYLHAHSDTKYLKAVTLLENVVKIEEANPDKDSFGIMGLQCNLATAYALVAKFGEATRLMESVLKVMTARLPTGHIMLMQAMFCLAEIYLGIGSDQTIPAAVSLLEKVLEPCKGRMEPGQNFLMTTQHNLAYAYLMSSRVEAALRLQESVVNYASETQPPDDEFRFASRSLLAGIYTKAGRAQEAVDMLREVIESDRRSLPFAHPGRIILLARLGAAYMRLENDDMIKEAVELLKQVVNHGRTALRSKPKVLEESEKLLHEARLKLRPQAHLRSQRKTPSASLKSSTYEAMEQLASRESVRPARLRKEISHTDSQSTQALAHSRTAGFVIELDEDVAAGATDKDT
ncbi:purine and uridine phosphorylase [Aureobasidium pullulans]|nr:purine and uridine phosphorylase [Aureobasidium pullulans]